MIAPIVHTLCNIALIAMIVFLETMVSLTQSTRYGQMVVHNNLNVFNSFIGFTVGIAVQVFRFYGVTLRQGMEKANMMVQVPASNMHFDATSCAMIVTGFEMLARWWIGALLICPRVQPLHFLVVMLGMCGNSFGV